MLLSAPIGMALPKAAQADAPKEEFLRNIDKRTFLISDLSNKVPREVRALHPEEEERIASILSLRFGMKVSPELEGKRLNRTYGFIGAEQHLTRYPGDTMSTHFQTPEEAEKIRSFWYGARERCLAVFC